MANTKFDIASSALVMIGANPISSFDSPTTAEEIACKYAYPSVLDAALSLYPWRFASRTSQLSMTTEPPITKYQRRYMLPGGMKAMQAIRLDANGNDIPYDRFENHIECDAGENQLVYCVHTFEPAISTWPGYFTAMMEITLALRLSFSLSGKLDLRKELETSAEKAFALAKNADSRQQTSRKFKVRGRGSIMEARRA